MSGANRKNCFNDLSVKTTAILTNQHDKPVQTGGTTKPWWRQATRSGCVYAAVSDVLSRRSEIISMTSRDQPADAFTTAVSTRITTAAPAASIKERILVMDDEELLRKLLKTILGKLGYE